MFDSRLAALQVKDPDAIKILQERPVVICVRGGGINTSEVLYEDRWGNQFKQWLEYQS